MKRLFIYLFFFAASSAFGAVPIPTSLTPNDQVSLIKLLGFTTSFHPIDRAFPLGGYSGLEFGASSDLIPTDSVATLGSTAPATRSILFPKITVGKGIYDSVDLFLSFIPFYQGSGFNFSNFGGAFRWMFYQTAVWPLNFSLLVSSSSTNFNDLFFTQTLTADVVAGFNVNGLSFYLGGGSIYGQGQTATVASIDGSYANQTAQGTHLLSGLAFTWNKIFAATEMDYYTSAVFSAKIGLHL